MVLEVPPELSVLAVSAEHIALLPSCAWISFGALAAGTVIGGTFAAQRWMQGSSNQKSGETKALLKKNDECSSGE